MSGGEKMSDRFDIDTGGTIQHKVLVLAYKNNGWFETALMRYFDEDPVEWKERKAILDGMVRDGLFQLYHEKGKRYRYHLTPQGLEIAERVGRHD